VRSASAENAAGLLGVALATGAFFCFPLHDAIIKWLLQEYGIQQILLIRSATAVLFALCLGRGPAVIVRSVRSPARLLLVGRSFIVMGAWATFYAAARSLKLAELITIYFASPLLVAILALFLLREHVTPFRWLSLGVGFLGVLVACRPGWSDHPFAVGLAIVAAVLWAYAMLLIRKLGTSEPTAVQMFVSNGVILTCCVAATPAFHWHSPGTFDGALLLSVGVVGTLAQYLLFESARRAVAAVLATMEFTSLVWAFLLGFLIWHDVPDGAEVLGAALIVVSGIMVITGEWRGRARARAVPEPAVLPDLHEL
jgi:drug/metabolite transporter (DMT)-like permease